MRVGLGTLGDGTLGDVVDGVDLLNKFRKCATSPFLL